MKKFESKGSVKYNKNLDSFMVRNSGSKAKPDVNNSYSSAQKLNVSRSQANIMSSSKCHSEFIQRQKNWDELRLKKLEVKQIDRLLQQKHEESLIKHQPKLSENKNYSNVRSF